MRVEHPPLIGRRDAAADDLDPLDRIDVEADQRAVAVGVDVVEDGDAVAFGIERVLGDLGQGLAEELHEEGAEAAELADLAAGHQPLAGAQAQVDEHLLVHALKPSSRSGVAHERPQVAARCPGKG